MYITKEVYVSKDYTFGTMCSKLRVATKVKAFLTQLYVHSAMSAGKYDGRSGKITKEAKEFMERTMNESVGEVVKNPVVQNLFMKSFGIKLLVSEVSGHNIKVIDLVTGKVTEK